MLISNAERDCEMINGGVGLRDVVLETIEL